MKQFFILIALCISVGAYAQSTPTAKHYGAEPITPSSKREWKRVDRPAIMRFFEEEVYGKVPPTQPSVTFRLMSEGLAYDGKVLRREVEMIVGGKTKIPVLIYLPAERKGKVPAFVGMNFAGNHNISPDEGITISSNAPKDATRGSNASRWAVEMITEAGYAVVTLWREDVDPDFDDGFQNGIHPHFYAEGQTKPYADEWGTIGAWAWSLSRVMDYLERDKDIDHKRVAVIGHSRLGKTALWAGAQDERFALVISNNSGCGGAALSARKVGETVAKINKVFPHWFCDNYNRYNDNEEALKVDQQGLIALIAPRPVYVASASFDAWADPEGEYLSALYASPVYELYGLHGLTAATMPAENAPTGDGHVGYHLRHGAHDITAYDWQQYIRFANRHFLGK